MKIVLKIFNAVYLVLAAVAITCFCTKPYIEIGGSYKVQGEQIAEFLPKEIEDYLSKDEIKAIIDNQEVKVELNLAVPAKLVFNYKDKEATRKAVNEMVETTVVNTMNELKPTIHEIAVAISKKVANSLIYNAIKEYTDKYKIDNPEYTDTALALDKAGIDAGYIEGFTEEVYAKLQSDNATIDGVMTVVDGKLVDVVNKLETTGIIETGSGLTLGSETSAEIKEAMTESFKSMGICDEDGNITDIDKAMENLLAGLLDELIKDGGSKSMVHRGDPNPEDVEEAESELTQKVRKLIDQYLEEIDIASYVTEYGLYLFIATMLLILPWALLALISLIKIIARKKCWVKVWFVFVFAFEQLLTGVVLTIATTRFLPQIANVIPLGDLQEVLSSLSLSIKTSSYIPSIIYLVLIPITIVYTVFAHKVKKDYKKAKKGE